jgi:type II secretory pathway component PulC
MHHPKPLPLKKLIHGIILFSFFLSAWILYWTYQGLQHTRSHPPVLSPVSTAHTKNLKNIADWQLFGMPPLIIKTVEAIPLSHLNLRLNGIIYSTIPHQSQAFITDSNGKTGLYHVNDIVSSGVILYDILPSRVILKNDREYEQLTLPRLHLFSP